MNSKIATLARPASVRDASTPAASAMVAAEKMTFMIIPYTCV